MKSTNNLDQSLTNNLFLFTQTVSTTSFPITTLTLTANYRELFQKECLLVLSHWPMMAEANFGGTAVEAEPPTNILSHFVAV